jgi:hypothetical protein
MEGGVVWVMQVKATAQVLEGYSTRGSESLWCGCHPTIDIVPGQNKPGTRKKTTLTLTEQTLLAGLGSGGMNGSYLAVAWLYKQYIKVEELGKQQRAIATYLDTVDKVLLGGRKGDLKGWASEQERVARREKGLRLSASAPLPDSDLSASSTEALESVGMVESMPGFSVTDQMFLRPLQKKDMVMSTAMDIKLRQRRRIPGRRAPLHSCTTHRAASHIPSLPPTRLTRSIRTSEYFIIWPIALHRVQDRGQTV